MKNERCRTNKKKIHRNCPPILTDLGNLMNFEIRIGFYRLSRREKDTFKPFFRRQTIRENNKIHKIKLAKKRKTLKFNKNCDSK